MHRMLVTLCAFLLLGSTTPQTNPHTVVARVERTYAFPGAHVVVGVAVLGHHVGSIDGGWLVKQNGPGLLHIDWSASGHWKGLTRTVQGPRDVSQRQLDAVLHTFERLGFPASTMRSWRVPAPVGYDGFNEGDKVLMIGQILIDLGTIDEAEPKLKRLSRIYDADNSPLDQIPRTNVRFSGQPFFGIDCNARTAFLQNEAMEEARIDAAAISSTVRTGLTAPKITIPHGQSVLCPVNRTPEFYRTSDVPFRIRSDFEELSYATVTLGINGTTVEEPLKIAPNGLTTSERAAGFPLAERYIGTFGKATADANVDAVVIHLHGVAANIERIRALVQPADFYEHDATNPTARKRVDAYILVRRADAASVQQISDIWTSDGRNDFADVTQFIQRCDAPKRRAVRRALARSRSKAAQISALLHAPITGLGAARITHPFTTIVCGLDPHASLAQYVAQMQEYAAPLLSTGNPWIASFGAKIKGAWLLRGQPATTTLTSTSYSASIIGSKSNDALTTRAFIQAVREAIVDNDSIVSLYEVSTDTFASDHASAQIVVLR